MKRALASFLVISFCFAVSPRISAADDKGTNPANVGIVAGLLTAVIGIVSLGSYFTSSKREETNQLAVTEGNKTARKQIDANVTVGALNSGVTSGTIDYGDVQTQDGDVVSRLDVKNIRRDVPTAQTAYAPPAAGKSPSIWEENIPSAPTPSYGPRPRTGRAADCQGLPPSAYRNCMANLRQ
ncbi:hypothetical protein HYT00_03375 [Candidatus Giovannonibacteria bacterium]|nr:hypothetical protein [Candidatus Giovannonibacteria bacterium]